MTEQEIRRMIYDIFVDVLMTACDAAREGKTAEEILCDVKDFTLNRYYEYNSEIEE